MASRNDINGKIKSFKTKKKKTHFRLAERYFKFLKRRTKIKDEKERKRLKFNIH